MSFLSPQGASSGLGSLLGVDPSKISSIANSIGTASNGIAQAGGATPGYGGQAAPQPNNFLQLSDPGFIRQLMAHFGSQPNMQTSPMSYSGPSLQQMSANLPGYAQ